MADPGSAARPPIAAVAAMAPTVTIVAFTAVVCAPVVPGETGPLDRNAAAMVLTRMPHAPMPVIPGLAADRRG